MTSMTAFGIYSGAKLSPLAGCILGFVVMVVTDALLGAQSACVTLLPSRPPQFYPPLCSIANSHGYLTEFVKTIPPSPSNCAGAMQMSASWNTQHVYLGFGAWTAFTYLGLALDLGIGQRLARNTEHAGWLSLAAVLGSLQFFVVSNFGVWATGSECVSVHWFFLAARMRSPTFSAAFYILYSSFIPRPLTFAFKTCFCLRSRSVLCAPALTRSEASMRTTWPA